MGRKLIIYPDTCFYGRPFDPKTQPRVVREAKAIDAVIRKCKAGAHQIIGSAAVSSEIGQISNAGLRADIEALYNKSIDAVATLSLDGDKRATELESQGLGDMDSVHLAIAEVAGADFLLTTDAGFIRKCNILNLSTVIVINPLDFWNGGFL